MRKRRIQNMTKAELQIELDLLLTRQKNSKMPKAKNRTTILIRYVKYHIKRLNREAK